MESWQPPSNQSVTGICIKSLYCTNRVYTNVEFIWFVNNCILLFQETIKAFLPPTVILELVTTKLSKYVMLLTWDCSQTVQPSPISPVLCCSVSQHISAVLEHSYEKIFVQNQNCNPGAELSKRKCPSGYKRALFQGCENGRWAFSDQPKRIIHDPGSSTTEKSGSL